MYTTEQLAVELDISRSAVNNRIRKLDLIPISSIGRKMYSSEQLVKLRANEYKVKYYPLKTTETFYIYESSMNNNN